MLYELITPGTIITLAFIAGILTSFFFISLFIDIGKHTEVKQNEKN